MGSLLRDFAEHDSETAGSERAQAERKAIPYPVYKPLYWLKGVISYRSVPQNDTDFLTFAPDRRGVSLLWTERITASCKRRKSRSRNEIDRAWTKFLEYFWYNLYRMIWVKKIMYKKYSLLLLLCNMIALASFCVLKISERSRYAATPAFQTQLERAFQTEEVSSRIGNIEHAESGQRVIGYQVMERKEEPYTEDDFQVLCRIVEAEAGGEDMNGRIMVANVVLNRVENKVFPNTIKGVVFQKNNGTFQFSPIRDGRYQRVKISGETKEAVERALSGEDYSEGALYFVSRNGASPDKVRWFDTHLTHLFSYGGHDFFS